MGFSLFVAQHTVRKNAQTLPKLIAKKKDRRV